MQCNFAAIDGRMGRPGSLKSLSAATRTILSRLKVFPPQLNL